jgi:hypothetical protein
VPSPIKPQASNGEEDRPTFMGGAVDKVKVQSAAIAGHLNQMLGTAGAPIMYIRGGDGYVGGFRQMWEK